jgi:hypothetical protein
LLQQNNEIKRPDHSAATSGLAIPVRISFYIDFPEKRTLAILQGGTNWSADFFAFANPSVKQLRRAPAVCAHSLSWHLP